MMKSNKLVRRGIAMLFVSILLSVAQSAQAQVIATTTFTRFGPTVVAVPTYYAVPTRYIDVGTLRQVVTNTQARWQVGLRTPKGVFTRSYQVDNSGIAIRLAQRQFPNASLIGVRKIYR